MAIDGMGSSTLAWITNDALRTKSLVDVLSRQQADGMKGVVYGDIAPDAKRAIDLRGEIARRDAYTDAVDRTLGRTAATQVVLGRLFDIATEFFGQAQSVGRQDPARIGSIAEAAKSALAEVAGLLNEQQAGEYLFGGSDSANPPVPSAETIASGGMASAIATAIAGLDSTNGSAIAATTLGIASDTSAGISPFSAFLEDPTLGGGETRRAVPTGDGQRVEWGLFANRNAAATSAGETTGGWARDLMRGLASLAALTPGSTDAGDGFDALMSSLRLGLKTTTDGIAAEQGALGTVESRLETIKTKHQDLSVALETQRAGAEEVGLAETISRLQDMQTRLQASWRVLDMVSGLSLTNFLR